MINENKTINDKINQIIKYSQEVKTELEQYKNKLKEEATIPNDKIVLSADMFSKIINTLCYVENQDIIEHGFVDSIFKDVKANRNSLTRDMNNYKPYEPIRNVQPSQTEINDINDLFRKRFF
jgi:hypothetical protein